jgi:hypothetical protein
MKEVAILLLVALLLNGCGTNSTPAQTAAGGLWSATMLGGVSPATGFSFSTEFTVGGSGGALTFSSFQFYTAGDCLAVNGEIPSGAMVLIVTQNTYQVTGTFNFTVESGGNTLALTGTVTGTENGLTGTTLSGGVITGTWTYKGSGTPAGCNIDTSGSFTMTQTS